MQLFDLFYNWLLTEEPTKSDFFTTQSENTKSAEIGCFQFEFNTIRWTPEKENFKNN